MNQMPSGYKYAYPYGYTHVYELNEFIDVNDPKIKFEDIILIELSYTDDGEETGTPYTINKRIQIRPDEQNYHCYNCYYVKLRAKENHCNKYPYCDIVAITSKK